MVHGLPAAGLIRTIGVLAAGLSLIAASVPLSTSAPDASPAEPAIAATASVNDDALIADRIRGIFAAIEGLEDVQVSVAAGVVTLSGAVGRADARERAETIASRVAGVVTVENAIKRELEVDGHLTAFGGINDRIDRLVESLPLLGLAAVAGLGIALLGYFLARLTGLWRRIARNTFLAELIASAIRFAFILLGLVVALDILGATALIGAVLGGAGVIGIALGFAMRDTIENYVASLLLSLRQPFRANDHVLIEGNEGRVVRLTSRATVLMTLDGNHLRIPNAMVFKAVILNFSRNPERRFDFRLGIDANDDPTAASALGVLTLREFDFVLEEPAPGAFIEEVGESNIVIRFVGWVDQSETDFIKARSCAIPAVKNALEEAGFALPEPIYRLRFDQAVPFQRADGAPQSGTFSRQPKRVSRPAASPEQNDTSPIKTVERLVADERAGADSKDDLLDSSRPVE